MPIDTLDLSPTRSQLQTFGTALGAVLATVGAWAMVRRQFWGIAMDEEAVRTVVAGAWGLGCSVIALALIQPRWLLAPYVILSLITYPIGVVISWLIMAVVYFFLVTPIGLFRRVLGRDSLRLKVHGKLSTYWVPREKTCDRRRYFRQY